MKHITVKGTGRASAKPDLITLSMTLTSEDLVYEKSMSDANEAIEKLREALNIEGFSRDDLKTTDFSINTIFESVKDRNDEYKQVFRGFRVGHNLTLEFDFDRKRLGRVLSAIAASGTVPEFRIGFTIKDREALSTQMLQNAVANARLKAEIIAGAAAFRLGDIISVDYSWSDVHFHSSTQFGLRFEKMNVSSMDIDIQPDDINVNDTVTIIWEITKKVE